MAFPSKLEDEIERRDGEGPRLPVWPKHIEIDGLIPKSRPSELCLDDISGAEFEKLIANLSTSTGKLTSFNLAATKFSGKQFKRYLRLMQTQADDLKAIIYFLAPRVLKLRAGPTKRSWQMRISKYRKSVGLD